MKCLTIALPQLTGRDTISQTRCAMSRAGDERGARPDLSTLWIRRNLSERCSARQEIFRSRTQGEYRR